MTKEEIAEMEHLCRLIQVEKDQQKFNELVAALNDLFDGKSRRLEDSSGTKEKS
jgi:hypothetical protein